jgi:DNA-binding XRE family transcriptional regulator
MIELPNMIQKSFDLIKKATDSPDALVLNSLLSRLSTLTSNHRVHVNIEHTQVPANYYGITLMPSGGGKDKSFSTIDRFILKDAIKTTEQQIQLLSEIKECGTVLYESDNGTAEGLLLQRENALDLGMGATNIKIGEFRDYILSEQSTNKDFLSKIVETYDMGNSSAKITKNNPNPRPVKGVPSCFFAHTSINGLLNEDKAIKAFYYLLDGGLARRSFIAYIPEVNHTPSGLSREEKLAKYKRQNTQIIEQSEELNNYFKEIADSFLSLYTLEEIKESGDKEEVSIPDIVLDVDDEALMDYLEYKENCQVRSQNVIGEDREGLRADLHGRAWKTVKLAGQIAYIEKQATITVECMNAAIEIAEYFGKQFEDVFNRQTETKARKVYRFITENSGGVSLMQIREQRFLQDRDFAKWWSENFEYLGELANEDGKEITDFMNRNGKRGRPVKYYKLRNIVKEETKVNISYSKDLSHNYKSAEINFDDMDKVFKGKHNYSAFSFKNGHRKQENWTGDINLLLLDIDNGMTLEKAKETFKEYDAIIATTKSHQKNKKGVVCDRFRVAIPLSSPISSNDWSKKDYVDFVTNFCKEHRIPNDKATIETARMFYPYEKSEVIRLNGGKLIAVTKPFREYIETPREPVSGISSSYGIGGVIASKNWGELWKRFGGEPNSIAEGDGSAWLWKCAYIMAIDSTCTFEQLEKTIRTINDMWNNPMPNGRLETTIINQARKYYKYDDGVVDRIVFKPMEERVV